jgi:co-chaperonin GroES (HSP10)
MERQKTPFTPQQVYPTREMVFLQRATEDDFFGDSPIVRPETHRAQMGLATVLAVGPEVKTIQPGDRVYLGKLAGVKMTELGEDGSYFLVHQAEISAVVREADDRAGC